MQNADAITTEISTRPKVNYLNNGTTIKSWLLTKDHKRIAIMYLISVSAFFFMGGLYAAAIRLEQPQLGPVDLLVRPPYDVAPGADMIARLRQLLAKIAK